MANEDIAKLRIDKAKVTRHRGKGKRNLYLIFILISIIIIVGFLYVKGILTPSIQVEVASVIKIYPSQTFTLLNASGYVAAQRKAAVASKVTGRLISLSVEEGSRIKAGQVIAKLESEDVAASKNQAEANLKALRYNLEQAKAELNDALLSFNRNKDLLEHGFVSKAEYDSSEARYRKAIAAVEAAGAAVKAGTAALHGANVALDYTLIRAPFDAVVLTKNADIGDIVTPIGAAANAKAAVVTIADMDSLQVEVDVSESNIHQIRLGQPCEIQLDALPDSRFRGEVHMIVPTADRTKATVLVKTKFIDKDSRILPEMSAKVAFLLRKVTPEEQKPLKAISSSSVITGNGKNLVYVVKGDRAVETAITIGKQLGDMTEVLQGVEVGDKVVVKPLKKVKDGVRVKTSEQ
ncbi:MAG: efflux RND transporter periplasmic adaptor subunit [Syntrophales bacterium]|nr:efflux RND transporter periplasmic adaptor subunit [Syntrophales bacterium]